MPTHTTSSAAAQQQEDTTQHTATSAGHGRHDWPQAKHTPAPNADSQSRPQTNGTSATQTTDKAGQDLNIATATGKTDYTKQPQASNSGHDTKPSHSSYHSRSQQANRKRKHEHDANEPNTSGRAKQAHATKTTKHTPNRKKYNQPTRQHP